MAIDEDVTQEDGTWIVHPRVQETQRATQRNWQQNGWTDNLFDSIVLSLYNRKTCRQSIKQWIGPWGKAKSEAYDMLDYCSSLEMLNLHDLVR